MDVKDWLQIVIVPVSLGMVALLWPYAQAASRRRTFMELIARELREVEPFPEKMVPDGTWTAHATKVFLHQKIFADPSQNRDFLLTIDANVAYNVSQLWESLKHADGGQWLYYLDKLAQRDLSGKLYRNHAKWSTLIDGYRKSRASIDEV